MFNEFLVLLTFHKIYFLSFCKEQFFYKDLKILVFKNTKSFKKL